MTQRVQAVVLVVGFMDSYQDKMQRPLYLVQMGCTSQEKVKTDLEHMH